MSDPVAADLASATSQLSVNGSQPAAVAAAPAPAGPPAIPPRPPAIPPRPTKPAGEATAASVPPPIPAASGPPPIPVSASATSAGGPPPVPASVAAATSASAAPAASSSTAAPGEDDFAPVNDGYKVAAKVTVEELMQKDSGDDALARYKASLLGVSGSSSSAGGAPTTAKYPNDPRPLILDHVTLAPSDHAPIEIDLKDPNLKAKPFTIKEGTSFQLILHFYIQHSIVQGIRYRNKVSKYGVKLDSTEEVVGSYAPSGDKLISFKLPSEDAPSGFLARTTYLAEGKLTDDDGHTHAEWAYSFEIKKDWK